jgi:hypothetical protein
MTFLLCFVRLMSLLFKRITNKEGKRHAVAQQFNHKNAIVSYLIENNRELNKISTISLNKFFTCGIFSMPQVVGCTFALERKE